MSNKIDERIVEMSFDNKRFEKGIGQSQKSLSDFKKSLDFKQQEKSLDSFASSFTKMGAVTFSVINNLTNKVLDFGLALAKSFTIDPIADGMNDYNTKLTTMQTITNATGKSIKEVEVYFDQLDDYADKTIYNLTDMTSAMAKFTNAGIELDRSVPAIKGIANMTALAGQDANAAQIAFYNLSQSIAGGFLNTMDYKSLNLANVATIEWKNNLIDSALALGTLTKKGNEFQVTGGGVYSAQQLFTEGLKDQWATTEALLDVLGDYGDETTAIGKKAQAAAQDVKSFGMMVDTLKAAIGTGWTRSFEAIIGNLEESKQLWTGITNGISAFIDRVSNARNEMLEFWKANGGRDAFLAGLRNVAIAFLKVVLAISQAFDMIFPPKTYQQIVNMFKAFENFTKVLIIGDGAAENVRRTFAGLFAVVDIFVRTLKFVGSVFGQIISEFFPGLSGGLLGITANLGDFLVAIHDLIVNGGYFQKMLEKTGFFIHQIKIFTVNAIYALVGLIESLRDGSITFSDIGGVIGQFVKGIGSFIGGLLKGKDIVTSFTDAFSGISLSMGNAKDGVNEVGNVFTDNMGKIREFIALISSKLLPAFDWIKDKLGMISFKHIAAIAVGVGLIKLAKTLLGFVNPFTKIADAFSGVLTSVSKALSGFTLKLKAEALFTVAKAIALIAVSLIALTMVPSEKLVQSLGILSIMMAELVGALFILSKIQNPAKIGAQLISLSAGLFIIALAAKQFESLSWEGLGKAGVAIAGFMAIVVIFSKVMGNATIVSSGMITMSIGLLAMTAAIKLLSEISSSALMQGTIAIAALLTVLAVYSKVVSGSNFAKASVGMISFGIGLIALTFALKSLSALPFETLLRGCGALLMLLSVLAIYSRLAGSNNLKNTSAVLIGLGLGLLAMTASLTILGKLPFTTLLQGSVALLALLATIALFTNLTNGKDLSISAGSLIGLGIGIMALSAALAILGSLDFSTLLQGSIALTGLLAVIAAFVTLTNGKDLGVTAGAMIAFAGGIALLAGVIALLTLLDTGAMLAATVAISGLILAIGGFSKLTNIGSLVGSAVGLVAFAIALAALSIPIKMIAEIPWEQLAATALVIVAAVGTFALVAAIMPIFAAVGPLVPAALVGVLGVAAIIAEIGLLVAAFGALSMIPGAQDLINGGGELLLGIGLALGKFVGGIVGGIGVGVTAGLPEMADNLSAFGIALQPFFTSIQGVDSGSVEAVKYLAETLLILGAASVMDALTSWLTGGSSLAGFAEELKEFAQPFVDFATILKNGNIDAAVIQNAANTAGVMSALATGLPNDGGVAAYWTGENKLSTFAQELKLFAQPFMDFCNILSSGTISEEQVKAAANAAGMMKELAIGLPNDGGVAAYWAGENKLSNFAQELKLFATPFMDFCNILSSTTINEAQVKAAANAAGMMKALAIGLPNDGGVAAYWAGENKLSSFAKELELFATPFVNFCNILSGVTVSEEQVRMAANAAMMMKELANNLPNQGGMVAWFTGDNTLSAFAEELVKFAPKFVQFVNEFSGIQASTVMPGIEALNLLVNTMQLSGKDAMNNLSKGFEDNKSATMQVIKNVLEQVVKSINDYYSKFVKSGEYVIEGFVKGMNNKLGFVKTKAKEIAQTVLTTVDKELGIHSPATELIEKGKNTTQGFINGITSKKDELVGSVKDLTSSTTDAFSGTNSSSFTKGIEDMINSLTSGFETGGTDAGNSFGSGLTNSNFSSALDSFSGKASKTSKDTTKKMKTDFEKFKEWLDEEKFYLRIDTAGEIEAWEKQQKLYKEGSEERKEIDRQLFTLRNKLIDESYQKELDYIEERNFYGQLSLEEELDALKLIAEEYEEGSEKRKKLDREIFTLEKKIYETQLQYIEDVAAAQKEADEKRLDAQKKYDEAISKASSTASTKTGDAQKKYDDSVAKASQDAAKKTADAHKKYTEKITKISEDGAKKRVDLEKSYAKDVEKIHEQLMKDVEAAEKRYTDAVKSRADTIYGYFGLFDKVGERQSFTAEELLKNLADQNAELEDWRSSLEMLEGRGVSKDLITELQNLGVSSNGQLKALLAMTDEQLSEFGAMFNRKHEISNFRALDELKGYREEVNREIAELYAQSDRDVAARLATFNEALAELEADISRSLAEAETDLNETLTDINTTLTEKLAEAKTTFDETMAEINADLATAMAEAKKTLDESMTDINKNLEEKLGTLKTTFTKTMETVHDKSASEYSEMSKDLKTSLDKINTDATTELGKLETTVDTKTSDAATDMSTNVQKGVNDSKTSLGDLNSSVTSIFSGFEQALHGIGVNGAQGLANGLLSGKYSVSMAGKSLGDAALDAVRTSLDVNSPSRELFDVGMFGVKGFANGILKYLKLAVNAGLEVGKASVDALASSLNGLTNLNFDELDITPVITPVLDLSQMRAEASAIDSMFGTGKTYTLAAETRVNASKTAASQNGSKTQEPVSVINQFDCTGMVVREEADIDRIADKLQKKQQIALRGRGGRNIIPAT